MSGHSHDQPVPRGLLIAAGALLGFALLAVTAARLTGVGLTQMPAARIVETRELNFHDRSDGSIVAYDPHARQVVTTIAPGSNGFLRGTLRGLARERKRQEVGKEPPFVLIRWSDGRLSLEDPATGRRVNLEAFGPVNAGVFAQMVAPDSARR